MLRGKNILRSIRAFAAWLGGAAVTKDAVTEWKAHLAGQHQAPSTINTALAALNGLFRFLGWEDCRAKFLKVQRCIFRAPERELTRAEYARLLAAANNSGDARLALLMESIFSVTSYILDAQSDCGGQPSPTKTKRGSTGRKANSVW